MHHYLTEKQQKVYDYISECIIRWKPPTMQEMTDHFWWKSKRNATQYIDMLEKKWYIKKVWWHRWLRLTTYSNDSNIVNIPILWIANCWLPLSIDPR